MKVLARTILTVLATVTVLGGCGSEASTEFSDEAGNTSSSTVETVLADASGDVPGSWREFENWEPTTLAVNGTDVGPLDVRPECLAGVCSSTNDDYGWAEELVVAAGADIEIRSGPNIDLFPTMRRLSDDLSFRRLAEPSVGTTTSSLSISLSEPGLHHVDIRGDVTSDDAVGPNRFRHFLWVQVVADSAPCLEGRAVAEIAISGATDSEGCPVESARLNVVTLHPDFHCWPWPATVALASRPGRKYLRTGFHDDVVDVVDDAPADLEPTDVFIGAGELLLSPAETEAVYVSRNDGTVERWRTPDIEEFCA